MKIIMLGQKGIPAIYGGIERHVEELATELAKNGHDILVYARKWYSPKNITKINGIKIIYTPSLRTKHLDAITHTLTSTIHALFQKPDIIHYHGVGPSLLSFIPRIFLPSAKVITTSHCLDRYHQKWNWLARLMLRLGEWTAIKFAHQTIVVSKTLQSYYLNEYKKQTTYIPNGVRTPNFSILPLKRGTVGGVIEEKWNLQSNKYLLMVSRLVKHKGAHYLLTAWQFVRQQCPQLLQDYKLVIVGGSNFTDNYLNDLKNIAKGDNSIIFTDWQSGQTLEELYANTALFVHPSENEGLPITVLQAMSHARPVLVSDISEHKEIITDDQFWFNNASIASLAEKIIELIKKPALLEQAGEENKVLVEKNYNWQDITKQTLKIYNFTTSSYTSSNFLKYPSTL